MKPFHRQATLIPWLACAVLWLPLHAHPQTTEWLMAPVGRNLYKVENQNLYVQTLDCVTPSQRTRAVLTYAANGDHSVLVLDGSRCAVKAVLGPKDLPVDRFSVVVTTRASEWHEIFGKNAFLKTTLCLKVVFAETAVLSILAKDDMRLIFKDGKTCTVEHMYSPVRQWPTR